ncbi:MAG: glycosyltransferase family 10 domain-containing protein [Methermicoccaceae archaeon]
MGFSMVDVWIDPFSDAYLGNELFGYDKLLNRDGCLSTWQYLREYCRERDINLNTVDLLPDDKDTSDDIYVSFNHKRSMREIPFLGSMGLSFLRDDALEGHFKSKLLFQFEPPVVHPHVYRNLDHLTSLYDGVFLVCKVDNPRCHYFHHHQSREDIIPEYWENTDRGFLAMVLSNKKPHRFRGVKELYSERLKIARFFAKTGDIDLYGFGWDKRPHFPYWLYKSALQRVHRGAVESKYPVLSRYNFAICFENCIMRGYITDRLFDCFFAGTIPVYWGAPDIEDYVPKECFIDMRDFKTYAKLREFLKSLTRSEIESYRENAREYLHSERFKPYTREHFAKMFVDAINGKGV